MDDINNTTSYTFKSLELAIMQNDVNKVLKLKSIKFDINKAVDGKTILSIAIRFNNPEIIKHIIKLGASTNKKSLIPNRNSTDPIRTGTHEPPIITGLKMDLHYEIFKLLTENKANLILTDDQGRSPLWIASIKGRPDYVNLFLQYNAPINFPSYDTNPLCIMIHFLGYSVGIRTTNRYPNHRSIQIYSSNKNLFLPRLIIITLIAAGLDLNALDNFSNNNPLAWSIKHADLGLTELLIESGASITPTHKWLQQENLPLNWQKNRLILEWLQTEVTQPSQLKRICRTSIRKTLRYTSNKDLRLSLTNTSFPTIPNTLLSYLRLEDEIAKAKHSIPSPSWSEILSPHPLNSYPFTHPKLPKPWPSITDIEQNDATPYFPSCPELFVNPPNPVCFKL